MSNSNNSKKKIIINCIVLVAIALIGCAFTYAQAHKKYVANAFNYSEADAPYSISSDVIYKEQITCEQDTLYGTQFKLSYKESYYNILSDATDVALTLNVYLDSYDNNIYSNTISITDIKNDDYTGVGFDSKITNAKGHILIYEFFFENTLPEYEITLACASGLSTEDPANVPFCIQTITDSPNGYQKTVSLIYLCLTFASIFAIAVFLFSNKNVSSYLHKVFLVVILGFSIAYAFTIPVMVAPDETVHLQKAYEVSNAFLGTKASDDSILKMRACDATVSLPSHYNEREEYVDYYNRIWDKAGDTTIIETTSSAVDAQSYLYFIPAIGITIGRLIGLNTILTYILGRLFAAILFAVAVSYAIKHTPIGKSTFFIWAMLPIMLQQINSYSYDCPINALSAVIIALTLEFTFPSEERVYANPLYKQPRLYIYIICCLLLAPCKNFALLPIAILPIVPIVAMLIRRFKPFETFKAMDSKHKKKVVAIILGVLMLCLVCALFIYKKLSVGPDVGYLRWAKCDSYTLAHYLRNPKEFIHVILYTIYNNYNTYILEMFGCYLGWLDISINTAYIIPFVVLIILSGITTDDENVSIHAATRIWFVLMAAGVVFLAVLGMLLYWTPKGFAYVLGVQGRYFLTALLLLILAFKGKWARRSANSDKWLIALCFMFQPLILASIAS